MLSSRIPPHKWMLEVMLLVFLAAGLVGSATAPIQSGPRLMPPHPRLWEEGKVQSIEPGFAEREIPFGFNAAGLQPHSLTGSIKTLAVLVEFSDKAHTVTASQFDSLIFNPPVSGIGSVRDYFNEISYGQIDIIYVTLPSSLGWITATHTLGYYTNANYCTDGVYPNNCRKLAEDIVDAVDSMVDFSNYDNDDNGITEPIMLIHAGPGAERTGSKSDIWSHSWSLTTAHNSDGVSVRDYVIMPEYWEMVTAFNTDMSIGVFAHEMGHGFWNLPDLYDTDYSSSGIGKWSLMAGGSWNGPSNNGASPSWPDAWSRIQMGITAPRELTTNTEGLLIPMAYGNSPQINTVFKISNSMLHSGEYFLIENRQGVSGAYDSYLPNSGMLIWHIDETKWIYNYENDWECSQNPDWLCSDSYHPLVQLEQADGLQNLELTYSNRGDGGDPFPGITNNRTFGPVTNPESSSYYGSGSSLISVTNISNSATEMTANINTGVEGTTEKVYIPLILKAAGPPAHLILAKSVINDNGGTATAANFILSAAGPTPISGAGGASGDVTAGTYTLSESGPAGYTASSWVCTGGTQVGNQVTLTPGQSASCTIMNDDQAPSSIVNSDFESGHTGWTEYSLIGRQIITNQYSPPHSGSWIAWLGGANDEASTIEQQVTVPIDTPYLAYWYWISSGDICGSDYDIGGVLINDDTAVDAYYLCYLTDTGGWEHRVIDLTTYAGQSVKITFAAFTDYVIESHLYIDDVFFQDSLNPTLGGSQDASLRSILLNKIKSLAK